MQKFDSDYMEGAHPEILRRIMETNMQKTTGYGTDEYCESARKKIREACNCPDAEIHFFVGGTQTNATVIDALLHSYEGVVAAKTGHISTHEAGAIEACGHKVLEIEGKDGKLTAAIIEKFIGNFAEDGNHDHMVAPGMVYISYPTEYGTLYTKEELRKLSLVCHQYKIPLYLDGARLGYGLAAEGSDVTLNDIAKYCDVFYIGGTKIGALFGEAVVITPKVKIKKFFTIMKQHGALLAKGRILGIQFDTLFTDNLYYEISRHAVNMALKLKEGFKEKGYQFFMDSSTNQQFIILNNDKLEELSKNVSFSFWEKWSEEYTVVRFATSWATKESDVDALLQLL
jgi:Threonine aldolase